MKQEIEISIEFLYSLLGIVLVFTIIYLWYKLIQSDRKRKESDEKFNQLESKINKLKLQTLESKLNPHLFKNILNSIQSHAYQTYFALDKLL